MKNVRFKKPYFSWRSRRRTRIAKVFEMCDAKIIKISGGISQYVVRNMLEMY